MPINQNTVFAASVTKISGAAVTIVSSGEASVWFAPSGTPSLLLVLLWPQRWCSYFD